MDDAEKRHAHQWLEADQKTVAEFSELLRRDYSTVYRILHAPKPKAKAKAVGCPAAITQQMHQKLKAALDHLLRKYEGESARGGK